MHTAALAELGLGRGVVLRGDRGRARGLRGPGPRRCRARASWARTSPSRTSSRRSRSPTSASEAARGDRRREHAQLRATDGSPPRTPTRAGFLDALPEPPAGKRALVLGAGGSARAVVWALVAAGAEVAIWNRTPERAERAGRRARRSSASVERPEPSSSPGDFDLIVNATTVGMGERRAGASGRPQEPADRCRFAGRDTPIGGPRLRVGRDGARQRRQGRAGQRWSTGSRCWSARGPRRFGSGPGWSPRSRR